MTELNEFGLVAFAISMSYATGVLWYNVLGIKYDHWMRIAALPLIGLVAAEAIWENYAWGGPMFMNLHIVALASGTAIAALGDALTQAISREHHVAKVVGTFAHLIRG